MKKYLFLVVCLFIFAAACNEKPQAPQDPPGTAARTLSAYIGSYNGILPCADCSGIDTELTLNEDGTFTLIEFYLSQESDLYLTEGTWKLNPDLSYVILTPVPEEGRTQQPIYYALKGIDLDKLDIHAKPIESTLNYTLRRK